MSSVRILSSSLLIALSKSGLCIPVPKQIGHNAEYSIVIGPSHIITNDPNPLHCEHGNILAG